MPHMCRNYFKTQGMLIQPTLDIINQKFFALIKDLDEWKISVECLVQSFIRVFVVSHTFVEVIDGSSFIWSHVVRTGHFHFLHTTGSLHLLHSHLGMTAYACMHRYQSTFMASRWTRIFLIIMKILIQTRRRTLIQASVAFLLKAKLRICISKRTTKTFVRCSTDIFINHMK